ncbi:hypothetical protein L0Z25_29610 [Burkholderia multivorans]|uniref:hypothetical protein n=1 Tax=Burkholderia multivorans TaxID=87883 RepID=UPI00207C74EE|nr:hypothetical protein [Burkholderia multivorans]MCO1362979.1 hypothetical protein [Burkholderia multivorans]MCO1363010.1 hypothetical protein [Burkholderia multivorans]
MEIAVGNFRDALNAEPNNAASTRQIKNTTYVPNELWLRKAIEIVQKNPSPDRIPLTGDERLKQRNYFYAGLDGIEGEGTY